MSASGRSRPPRCALCSRAPAPGVNLVDDAERNYFPRPPDASGQDAILAGRIRQDVNDRSGRSVGSSAMTINS
jgi:aspartate-semialdehyde dehydrogenase